MADVPVPSIATATPADADSVLGVKGGAVKRFLISALGAVITFLQSGTGAVSRTVQNKLRESVSVKDFGAVGDGVADDTAAIQAALDAAQSVFFPDGNYLVSTLYVRTYNNARLHGRGVLFKKSDGTLLDNDRSGTTIEGLRLDGRDFGGVSKTGHNIVSTGSGLSLINVSSVSAAGRAVWAKNGGTKIIGGNYTTSDTSSTGYDIELGDGGTTQSLYNFITAMATNQSFGGILANTAELRLTLCQIGKLTSTGSGVLQAFGNRIIGDVQVQGGGSVISGCNLAGSSLTLLAGSAGCSVHNNSVATGFTMTNLGNGNSLIENNVSTGSYPVLEYGATNSGGKIALNAANYFGFSREIRLTGAIRMYAGGVFEAGGTAPQLLGFNSGGAVYFGTGLSFVQYNAASAHQFIVNSVVKAAVDAKGIYAGGSTAFITQGAGSPEGVVTATPGCLYQRTDGAAGTCLYVKETGTGSTGWVAK